MANGIQVTRALEPTVISPCDVARTHLGYQKVVLETHNPRCGSEIYGGHVLVIDEHDS